MPELPEVETVVRDLRRYLPGARIEGVRVDWARTLRPPLTETELAAGVRGRTIEAIERRAKLIVLRLSGDTVVTIHLKMTGQLFVVPSDSAVDPYVRLVLALDGGRELRFRDIRKFGKVGLYQGDVAGAGPSAVSGGPAAFDGLGPEPLDPAFTLGAFRGRLRARKGRLKALLVDQGFVAGIGNIYADEALHEARLHPLRSARTLRPPDERRLYLAIRRILAEAVERRGSSIDDYTAPDGDGQMQERLLVYQRTGLPCARCGRPVRRIVVGTRATHFCSWCQRLPAADRNGSRRLLATGRAASAALAGASRGGPRWTELAGEGALGLTAAERRRASAADRTRAAAATRRAAARAVMTAAGENAG